MVDLACRKANDSAIRTSCGLRGCWRVTRANMGPRGGARLLRPPCPGHRLQNAVRGGIIDLFAPGMAKPRTPAGRERVGQAQAYPQQQALKPHNVRYYLERCDAAFEPKTAEVLCIYREVAILKRLL